MQKTLCQSGIAVTSNVFLYVLWINETAVAEGNPHLLAVKVHVLGIADAGPSLWVDIQQTLHPLSADDMVVHDIIGIVGCHLGVESVVRDNLDHRTFLAEAETSRRDYIHLVPDTFLDEFFLDSFAD